MYASTFTVRVKSQHTVDTSGSLVLGFRAFLSNRRGSLLAPVETVLSFPSPSCARSVRAQGRQRQHGLRFVEISRDRGSRHGELVTKAEQTRLAAWRSKMLQRAGEASRNVARTCRHFGISRKTFSKWKRRHDEHGAAGLCDRPRTPTDPRGPRRGRSSARFCTSGSTTTSVPA